MADRPELDVTPSPFFNLPDHLCFCVFRYLNRRQKASVRQTCGRFRKLVNGSCRTVVLNSVPVSAARLFEQFDKLSYLSLSPEAWWSPEVVAGLLRQLALYCSSLETLDLRGCLQLSVDVAEAIRILPFLRSLHLPDSSSRDDGWSHLSHLSHLTHLAVVSSEQTFQLAAQLPSLQQITPFPPLESTQAPDILPLMPSLTSISIRLVSTTCPSLHSLQLLTNLTALHMSSHSVALPFLTVECWQQICDLSQLQELELDGFVMEHTPTGQAGFRERLAGLVGMQPAVPGQHAAGRFGEGEGNSHHDNANNTSLPNFRSMYNMGLGYNTAGRKKGAHLSRISVKDCLDPLNLLFPGWPGLRELRWTECLFSTLQLEQLSNLSQLVGLTRLELVCVWRGSGLLAQWLDGLTPAMVPPQLQELSLKCCGLLGTSLLLACFRHFPELRRLELEENCILSDTFFRCLTQLSSLQHLNHLRVRCSRINPSVLPYFLQTAGELWPALHLEFGNVLIEHPGDLKLCLLGLSTLPPSYRLALSLQFSHFLDIDDVIPSHINTLATYAQLTSATLSFASDYILQRAPLSLSSFTGLPELQSLTLAVPSTRAVEMGWRICEPLINAGVQVVVRSI